VRTNAISSFQIDGATSSELVLAPAIGASAAVESEYRYKSQPVA